MALNDESILNSIKKLLGLDKDYDVFDQDVILYINSALSYLHQIGVGPNDGFAIADESAKWSDLISDNKLILNVKSYIYIKVRLLFDPPSTSYAIDALDKQAKEHEWRINAAVDPRPNFD